ncbi:MAG: gliding motility-associated protein GldE [Flavobacteriales bacterium]|nr:MAG: gliding motility-associated protein GldE [Flavobacteriales bacterium]
MDPDPEPIFSTIANLSISYNQGLLIGLLLTLIFISALISGSEVAFFSWNNNQEDEEEDSRIQTLQENPKKLLATILVSNNFINIGIVILAAFISESIFDFSENPLLGYLYQIIGITFILLLFGEVLPKIYASRNPRKFIGKVVAGMYPLYIVLLPISRLLAKTTQLFKDRTKNQAISVDDLSQALELAGTDDQVKQNQMLVDIVMFGNTSARQVMTPRVDMIAIAQDSNFTEVLETIREAGYSRLPVYKENLDEIIGILYIKDLLAHIENTPDFHWQNLIRKAFFVPESKKIDDLLQEFRSRKVHLAIVVDEFGGTSGLITLEDIIEEVVGEINDEFDLEESGVQVIDEQTYIFEGKISINDFLKYLRIEDTESFENAKGDSDTLAGFFIERTGELPEKNQEMVFQNIRFIIEEMEDRRINRIKVIRTPNDD